MSHTLPRPSIQALLRQDEDCVREALRRTTLVVFGQELTELLGVRQSERSPVRRVGLVELRLPQDRERRV